MLPLNNIKIIGLKKLAYLLLISICLTSCKQCKRLNGHTEVSGRVLDGVSGKSVAYARVALGTLESTWGGVIGQTIDRMTTDAQGNYSFKFTAGKGKNYYLIAKADGYFESHLEAYPVNECYRTINYNIGLPPQGTIKFHIKKTDLSYDSLILGIYTDQGNCGKDGRFIDSYCIFSNKRGGENFMYDLRIIKYNNNTPFSDTLIPSSVYCLPIDTTHINLNY